MADQRCCISLRIISAVVLSFFIWTFNLSAVALAMTNGEINSKKLNVKGNKSQNQTARPDGKTSDTDTGAKPEEKFQTTLKDIEDILNDTATDTDTKKGKLKSKKTEIENLDVEIKKQFGDTETKIKDLPDTIKQRHKDFVKKYDDNLKELKTNLDNLDKAKTKAEADNEIDKTKTFLKKVKPPKKHIALDPDKLPHRTEEPVFIEPRTTKEEFENEIGKGSLVMGHGKPLLVASNGSLKGLISPTSEYHPRPYAGEGWGEGATQNLELKTQNYLQLALAYPPTDADLAETIEVKFTDAIKAKAAELNYNPTKIYNWVRNNIEYVPTYGSIQGADMCLQTKQCNDFDTASLLIALLRTSGIHAKYVYGTIELPIEKVKNWVGGFTDSMAALNLIASGGIPVRGISAGGKVEKAQIEHIWVEGFIDYIPSRGEIHRKGDMWIPLDASFKQYTYTSGIDIKTSVPFEAQSFIDQLKSTATINETEGYVTNVSSSYIQTTMTDYQTRVQNYITQNYPNATVGDVIGKKEIIKQEFRYLLGTLPYKRIVTGTKYSSLPDSLRYKMSFSMTSDDIFYDMTITKSIPEIAGKKITLSYTPATQADEDAINSYLPKAHTDGTPIQPSELPSSLPAYLLNLKPELRVDGTVIATGSVITMGQQQELLVTISSPTLSSQKVRNRVISGEFNAVTIDISRVSSEQMTAMKTRLESTKAKLEAQNYTGLTKEDILGDLLYTTVLSYFAELGVMDFVTAKTMGVISIRLPSIGRFFNGLAVDYIFDTPLSVSSGGLTMDIGMNRKLTGAFDGDKNKRVQFMMNSGTNSSALEHLVPEQLFSTTDNPAQGISAVKALQLANEQGIPIYTINQSNINTVLPNLQVDSYVKTDIQNAVNAGKIVTVSKTNITFNGWTGCGYIVIDPNTGAGAYLLGGGMNGSNTDKLDIAYFIISAIVGLAIAFTFGPVAGVIASNLMGGWIYCGKQLAKLQLNPNYAISLSKDISLFLISLLSWSSVGAAIPPLAAAGIPGLIALTFIILALALLEYVIAVAVVTRNTLYICSLKLLKIGYRFGLRHYEFAQSNIYKTSHC